MSTSTSKSEYLLLFRGTEWDKGLSPEEMQKVMGQFMGWFDRLSQEGILKAGQPLAKEGKVLSGKGGKTLADGPFAESKETIAGYFLLNAPSLDRAVEIARECPTLQYGCTVEVRPVAEQCPTMQKVAEFADRRFTSAIV